MDVEQALADLTEISSQIQAAAIMDAQGEILGSTIADGGRAETFAKAAFRLLSDAEGTRRSLGPDALTQLEAATLDGSVFVVRERERVIAATTTADPTVGLVFYDLKSCLRNVADEEGPKRSGREDGEPKRRRTAKKAKDAES